MARHLESKLQQNCITWFDYQHSDIKRLLFSVQNGGFRKATEAKIMKGEGVRSGVADLILLIPKGIYSALCLEMKTSEGKQSDLQKSWQELAEKHGNKYIICRSFDQFRDEIQSYLSLKS